MREDLSLARHLLATTAYRFQKTIRNAPPNFSGFAMGHGVRSPFELVRHMGHDLYYAIKVTDESSLPSDEHPMNDLEDAVIVFHQYLEILDQLFLDDTILSTESLQILLQGPLTDVMTHVGQLAMMRRAAGSPLEGESFVKANITTGNVGTNQALK